MRLAVFCWGLKAEVARVLLISPTSRGVGGIAQHVAKLAEKLRFKGMDVRVISSSNTPTMPVKGLMNPSFAAAASLKVALRSYHVVHAHNLPSSLPMRTARGRRILTLHGVYSEQVRLIHGGLLGRVSGWFEKRAFSWADAVTAVSKQAVKRYSDMGFDVVHIPNAIDLEEMPTEGYRLAERQVVYVGRLSKEKGVETLLEAAPEIKDSKILIIGSGPEEARLKARAKHLDNVMFLGEMPRQDALKHVRGSDVLVLPSLAEGLSTVLLEAMALRTPVVATQVGGNTELITHMETGVLVERGDAYQTAEAVNMLLDKPQLAKTMAERAYQLIANNYSWPVVLEKYLSIYGLG